MTFKLFFILLALLPVVACSKREALESETAAIDYPAALGVVKRSGWGWQPGDTTLARHKVSKITIHHGGEEFPKDKDPVLYLQNFQAWCRTEKNWMDNPYHFMIDLEGGIYETRPIIYPGDTNTGYDPTGHALICVMGNYEVQILSQAQLAALIDLTAFLQREFEVPANAVKAHKDYTETLCPGKDLYRYLEDGTIRAALSQKKIGGVPDR